MDTKDQGEGLGGADEVKGVPPLPEDFKVTENNDSKKIEVQSAEEAYNEANDVQDEQDSNDDMGMTDEDDAVIESSAETEENSPEETPTDDEPLYDGTAEDVAPVAEEIVTESHNQFETPTSPPKKSHKKLIIFIIVGVFLLLGAGGIAGFMILKKDEPEQVQKEDTTSEQTQLKIETEAIGTPIVEPTEPVDYEYIEPVFLDVAVSWNKPQKIDLQGFYKNEKSYSENKEEMSYEYDPNAPVVNYAQYYRAGTFEGGEIIYGYIPANSLGQAVDVFMVKDGQATLLGRYGNNFTNPTNDEYFMNLYTDVVTVDTKSLIKGTWAPEKLTINGQNMKVPSYETSDGVKYAYLEGNYNPETYVNPDSKETLVRTIPEGKIYEITLQKDGYRLSLFELELPNYFRVSYVLDGEISNADVQPIAWNDGSRNTYSYANFGYGCGGGSYYLIADVTLSDLVQIGKSDGGQPIYSFKDINQKVAAQILSEVNSRDGQNWIEEGKDPKFTAEEFVAGKTVIIVQDGMDRWVVFKNEQNFLSGGCAKPVIYLYPESPMNVDVAVGADVTISEPFYEENGWEDVTALPNGQLIYRGLPYESLFWEGQAYGNYPDTSGRGFVVKHDEVVTTMYDHLKRQGFNQKESDDFVEFWELNIPEGEYVRMTWLTTHEMNMLAPLTLSVRPDTVIRTFLEMEGLDAQVSLRPQTFVAPMRRGFTVTEWGGLAVRGLDSLVVRE